MIEQAVVGVGNQVMRDDGLGIAAVNALREDGLDDEPGVTLETAGTTAFFALEAMDGADRAIVVDALQVPGTDPGTLHRMVYQDGAFDTDPEIHMHDFSFVDALTAGQHAYDVPSEIVVIGMTPASLTAGVELTETVRRNFDDLLSTIRTELGVGRTSSTVTQEAVR